MLKSRPLGFVLNPSSGLRQYGSTPFLPSWCCLPSSEWIKHSMVLLTPTSETPDTCLLYSHYNALHVLGDMVPRPSGPIAVKANVNIAFLGLFSPRFIVLGFLLFLSALHSSAHNDFHPSSLSLLGTCGKEHSGTWWSHPRVEGDPGVKPAGGGIGVVQESTINRAFVLFMCFFPPSLVSLLVESSWVQSHRGERPFHQVGPILFCFCSSQDLVVFHLNYAPCISGWRAHNLWRSLSYKPTPERSSSIAKLWYFQGWLCVCICILWVSLVCIVCAYMHVYMYVHTCVFCIYGQIWTCMYMNDPAHGCVLVCLCVCMCVCACVSLCVCMLYVLVHARVCAYV